MNIYRTIVEFVVLEIGMPHYSRKRHEYNIPAYSLEEAFEVMKRDMKVMRDNGTKNIEPISLALIEEIKDEREY